MEQLLVTVMSVVLAFLCLEEFTTSTLASMLLSLCCIGLTLWMKTLRNQWAWIPPVLACAAPLAIPSLTPMLPAAGYACAQMNESEAIRTAQTGDVQPANAQAHTRTPREIAIDFVAPLIWIAPIFVGLWRAATSHMEPTAQSPSLTLICSCGLLTLIAFIMGYESRQADRMGRAWQRAQDERRDNTRDMRLRLSYVAEERATATRMAKLHERTRIARDIHDNVGHLLTRAIMQTEAARVVADTQGNVDAAKTLCEVSGTLHETMIMVRRSVHDLDDAGTDFAAMIDDAVRFDDSMQVVVNNDITHAPAAVARCCCMVIREALSNAARHGSATQVQVNLHEFPAFWQLVVQDNGGSDSANQRRMPAPTTFSQSADMRGMGLSNIEARVRVLNGTCAYGPNELGWRVFASIPKARLADARPPYAVMSGGASGETDKMTRQGERS